MNYENAKKIEKMRNEKLIEELKLSKSDLDLLQKETIRMNPSLKDFKKSDELEFRFYSRLNSVLMAIRLEKTSDIKEHIEKLRKKEKYDIELMMISQKISFLKLGDKKSCNKLDKDLEDLLERAEKEFPGFSKGRALQISEISQRIMAYRTKGAVGHQAEVREIRKKIEKEQKSKGKKKGTK